MILFFTHRAPMASSSVFEKTLPTGLCGELSTIMRVCGLMAFSSAVMSMVQSAAEVVLVAPSLGGWRGTYFIVPPGISILDMYLGDFSIKLQLTPNRDLLVEEWFEYYNLVSRLDKTHERTKHALIRTCSDGNLCVWIDLPSKEGRVCICYCLLQPWPTLVLL